MPFAVPVPLTRRRQGVYTRSTRTRCPAAASSVPSSSTTKPFGSSGYIAPMASGFSSIETGMSITATAGF